MIAFNDPFETPSVGTSFQFTTDLTDSYEKYPESVVSGLTKIGGILALVRIVQLVLFYIHRYLFEAHIKKQLSLKDEGGEDENDSQHLKVRYSIENYEKLLVSQEEMRDRHEELLRKYNEKMQKSREEMLDKYDEMRERY